MVTAEAREMVAAMAAANAVVMASTTAVGAIAALREFSLLMRQRGYNYNHIDDGGESGSEVRAAVIAAANEIVTQR